MQGFVFDRLVGFATGPAIEEEPHEMEDFTYHRPVLATEVIDLLGARPGSLIVDATRGGGGHVLAHGQDPDAIEEAANRLASFRGRVTLRRINFRYADNVLDELDIGK